MLKGLEGPPGDQPAEEIPEYVGDLADMVELSESYTAMLGMLRKQCIENGLSEQAADAYVLMVITKMAQP